GRWLEPGVSAWSDTRFGPLPGSLSGSWGYTPSCPRCGRAQPPPRPLVDTEPPVTQPAHAREPRPRRPHRRRPCRPRRRPPPTLEPPRSRPRVQAARSRDVLAPILQHVDQRRANLARRPQPPCMVSITPHRATPPERAVHRLRDPHRQTLTAAG